VWGITNEEQGKLNGEKKAQILNLKVLLKAKQST